MWNPYFVDLYLQQEVVDLTDSRLLRKALFIPDTLSLYEVLELGLNLRGRLCDYRQ